MEIKIDQLDRQFGKTHAVDDLSFSFRSGQIFGFLGPNGAGKTTTMRIMATLDEPTYGDVYIDGTSVVEFPEKARARVGYMPDHLPTHRDMSVTDYLDFFARAYGLKGEKRKKTLEQIKEFTNLTGIRNKSLVSLSKGMKQRVSLARALLHDPPVLIMDEPAAGLDPRARIELRELLKVLSEQGKAILISSHILSELAEICHGAVIIEHGRLLAAGTVDEIIKKAQGQEKIVIQVEENVEGLQKELLQTPGVENVKILDNNRVEIEHSGRPETGSRLLAALVGKGFLIREFREYKVKLEDVFMKITKGEVQ